MSKHRKITREEYKEKFDKIFDKYNYVPESGEDFRQCKAPYPDYWFLSNNCRLFSVKGKLKRVRLHYRSTGKKNKAGERSEGNWYFTGSVNGKKFKVTAHKLMLHTFGKCEFTGYESEKMECHHKKKANSFQRDEGRICNSLENLQMLPRSIHTDLTHYASKTLEESDREIERKVKEENVPTYQYTQEQLQAISHNALSNRSGFEVIFLKRITDDVSQIKAEAYPLDAIKITIER